MLRSPSPSSMHVPDPANSDARHTLATSAGPGPTTALMVRLGMVAMCPGRANLAAFGAVLAFARAPAADAHPPHDGLFRAAPGFGYTLDTAEACTMQGRMFV